MNSWTENLSSGKYLYIEDNSADGSYESKMASAVDSPYLLAPSAVFIERKACFEYNISGLVSLDEYINGRNIDSGDIISMLTQIDTAAAVVQNYLLSESSMLIDPEHIYADKQKNELRICVVPEHNGCFEEELKLFILRIVPCINIDDSAAMRTGIKLMRAVSKKDYRLHDVLEMLNNDGIGRKRSVEDSGSMNRYCIDRGDLTGMGQKTDDRGYAAADRSPSVYADNISDEVRSDIYGETDRISAAHAYGYNDDKTTGIYDGVSNEGFVSQDVQKIKRSGVKSEKNKPGIRAYRSETADDQDTDVSEPQIGESITGMLISQAILAGIAVMVFMIKGRSAAMRLLPIYAIMAVCLLLYYIAGIVIRRRKARV